MRSFVRAQDVSIAIVHRQKILDLHNFVKLLGYNLKNSVADPDPHDFGKPDPDPHQNE
jgi:hypothetical protein